MVLRLSAIAALCLAVMVIPADAASAHRDHAQRTDQQSEQSAASPHEIEEATDTNGIESRSANGADTEISSASLLLRAEDWLGRTHPMFVHFPLALFPLSLFAAVLARRRDDWNNVARISTIVAGLFAVPASLFGWFAGGLSLAADDSLLSIHRWLGSGIALTGAYMALAAWRRTDWITGNQAILMLAVITATLIVQGWYGGVLVHGTDHLSF